MFDMNIPQAREDKMLRLRAKKRIMELQKFIDCGKDIDIKKTI